MKLIMIILCLFICIMITSATADEPIIWPDECDLSIEYKNMYRLEISYPTCEGCNPVARFCKDPSGYWIALKDVNDKISIVYAYPLIEAFIEIFEENCNKTRSNKILISY